MTGFTVPARLGRERRTGITTAGVAAALRLREPVVRGLTSMLPLDVLFSVDTAAGAVAITFDDGPQRDTTEPLLDVLARHRARATFFLIGERIAGNESTVARIAADGHELANHLMRDQPSVLLGNREFARQLRQVTELLSPYGEIRWFRPGSGWFTPRMVRSAAEQGLRCVLGTVTARHDGTERDRRIATRVASRLQPGSIAVLHEGLPERRGVVESTDQILAALRRRGLTSVTVSELAALRR